MPRLLLIIPASTYRAAEFLDAAEAVGAEPIVATNSNPLLAMRLGDRFIDLDDCSTDEIVRRAKSLAPIHGVLSPDDSMVVLANAVASELGLESNPPWAVAATKNKAMLRRALDGIAPQPAYLVVTARDDVTAAVAGIGPPVVMKPLSLSGSQGVIRVDDASQAPEVEERIRRILAARGSNPDEPLLVERFVPGPEVAVEGLLTRGRLEILAVFDKPDPLDGPYFEETMYVTPSRHGLDVLEAVRRTVQAACDGLELATGPIHAELRIHDSAAILIEMAARPIGGRCGTALRFGAGVSHEMVLARAALGMRDDVHHAAGSAGSLMIPIPRSGVLRAVHGLEEARGVAGITGIDISVPFGELILALPEGHRYLGFAYASTPSPAETERALRRAMALIRPQIEPGGGQDVGSRP